MSPPSPQSPPTSTSTSSSYVTFISKFFLAGQYGRQGLNCTKLYEDCNINEQTFIEFAQLMPWSPVGELKHLKKLVSWVWKR